MGLKFMMIGGGWLDQVGIRLTQLSTGLKVEAELGNNKSSDQLKLATYLLLGC